MVYCPYTDSEIEITKTSPEHIIPLSLGGMNGFEIPVCKNFNSSVGSKIDGAVANDFGIKIKRGKVDARGHSNKKPIVEITKARCSATGKPLKVSFEDNGLKLWSHLDKEYLRGKNTVRCEFKVKLDIEEHLLQK